MQQEYSSGEEIANSVTHGLGVLVSLAAQRGGRGWSLFGVIWGLAILGILFKIRNTGRWGKVSAAVYVLMGWLCVIALHRMIATIPVAGLAWLFAGGLCYTGGLAFYGWKKLPYNHAVWHLFVLGGSACHFFAILFHVPGKMA